MPATPDVERMVEAKELEIWQLSEQLKNVRKEIKILRKDNDELKRENCDLRRKAIEVVESHMVTARFRTSPVSSPDSMDTPVIRPQLRPRARYEDKSNQLIGWTSFSTVALIVAVWIVILLIWIVYKLHTWRGPIFEKVYHQY